MRTSNRRNLLWVLGLLLVVLSAGAYGTGMRHEQRSSAREPLASGDTPSLVQAMNELRSELALLRDQLAQGTLGPATGSAPLGTGTRRVLDEERLLAALEALARPSSAGAPGLPAGLGQDGRSPAGTRDEQQAALRALEALPAERRLEEHFLLAPQTIVQRYGLPDSVYRSPEGEVYFTYLTSDPERPLQLGFVDGLLVHAGGG